MEPPLRPGKPPRPYHRWWNLIPLLGGLLDPFAGVFTAFLRIFRPVAKVSLVVTSERLERGLVLVLGGMEGPSRYAQNVVTGLLAGGYPGAIEVFDWNAGPPIVCCYRNLADQRHHHHQARRLAERIRRHEAAFPGSPVSLIAHSSGCWIVWKALELIRDNKSVDRAVLLAPSISPAQHPGTPAAACRRGLWSIGSPGDYFFLGLGTTLFGTSDRAWTPAAGWIGWHHFDVRGFEELRWHPAWVRYGYWGNHTTCTAVRFVQCVLAPGLAEGGLSPSQMEPQAAVTQPSESAET